MFGEGMYMQAHTNENAHYSFEYSLEGAFLCVL